ncbi:GTPase required for pre-60S ribosomal subunit nuclear export and maturation [Ascosphaera acerosa]|nr:GTPase required for pre-60S ribosomal subunit nuclear export and maturation [Ascosphaera acerosa]
MGTGKKEANRKVRQGKTGDGMGNVKVKGENFYRYVPLPLWRAGRAIGVAVC